MTRIVFIFAFFLTSTALAKTLKINSTPEMAEVYIGTFDAKELTKAGQTPLNIQIADLGAAVGNQKMFVLEVRKKQHKTYRIAVPILESSDIELNMKLDEDHELDLMSKTDGLVNSLFEIQRLIRAQQYDSAFTVLADIEKDFPHLSVLHELKGSAHYIKKDYKKAYDAYSKAVVFNAANYDAYKMRTYLEKILGIKKPLRTDKPQ